jgi:hypothetical protein
MYRLPSQGRCRFHRRSKRLDQDPRGTRAHGLSPRPEMSVIQGNVSGQTVSINSLAIRVQLVLDQRGAWKCRREKCWPLP